MDQKLFDSFHLLLSLLLDALMPSMHRTIDIINLYFDIWCRLYQQWISIFIHSMNPCTIFKFIITEATKKRSKIEKFTEKIRTEKCLIFSFFPICFTFIIFPIFCIRFVAYCCTFVLIFGLLSGNYLSNMVLLLNYFMYVCLLCTIPLDFVYFSWNCGKF